MVARVHAEFLEGACVKEGVDAFASGKHAFGVYCFKFLWTNVVLDPFASLAKVFNQFRFDCHDDFCLEGFGTELQRGSG